MDRYQMISFTAGLLSGAVVGGLIGTLLAPQSGNEARKTIIAKVDEIKQAGKQARFERRQKLETQYKEAIRIPLPTDQEVNSASSQMNTA